MSIRNGLLALLEQGPMYGYQLRSAFEASTAGTWPLNIGQVYSTLARLERDGLVEPEGGADAEGRVVYRLTHDGRASVHAWFAGPVDRDPRTRDELAVKVALALAVPGVDPHEVIRVQRTATVRSLQELTRLKARSDGPDDGPWRLVLESMVFHGEAEVRWLDHCEEQLVQHPARRVADAPAPSPARVRA
jgi:DNA-binding PadR family transcriptional regulator